MSISNSGNIKPGNTNNMCMCVCFLRLCSFKPQTLEKDKHRYCVITARHAVSEFEFECFFKEVEIRAYTCRRSPPEETVCFLCGPLFYLPSSHTAFICSWGQLWEPEHEFVYTHAEKSPHLNQIYDSHYTFNQTFKLNIRYNDLKSNNLIKIVCFVNFISHFN